MKKDWLTRVLAIFGTVLTGFPFLVMFGFSAIRMVQGRQFLFDFLMPGELFIVILVGAGLLIWAAFRSRNYQKLITILFGLAVFFLIASQVLAGISGLASGAREPAGGWWIALLGMLGLYDLLAFGVFIAGIMLIRCVFQHSDQLAERQQP